MTDEEIKEEREKLKKEILSLFPDKKDGEKITYEDYKRHKCEIFDLVYNRIVSITEKEVK